jgi:DNA end-binding protein Ku
LRTPRSVIRDAINKKGMVALGRVVLSTREHVIALEARDKGILGMLLHYPYEVRKPEDYYGDIPDEKAPKEMLDLAAHIIDTMAGHFDPEKFDDRYEDALRDLIKRKAAGEKITPAEHPRPKATTNLMDALRAGLAGTQKRPPAASVHRRSAGGGRKPAARSNARRKATG